jgi:hypothetical protein
MRTVIRSLSLRILCIPSPPVFILSQHLGRTLKAGSIARFRGVHAPKQNGDGKFFILTFPGGC